MSRRRWSSVESLYQVDPDGQSFVVPVREATKGSEQSVLNRKEKRSSGFGKLIIKVAFPPVDAVKCGAVTFSSSG